MPESAPSLFAVYAQVNTIRGYRYLDDVGKVMNHFDALFPSKNVGLPGLTMTNQDSKVRTLQVSSEKVWVQIEQPDTLRFAIDNARNLIEEVSDLIGVTAFKRVGLRVEYLVSSDEPEQFFKAVRSRILSQPLGVALGLVNPIGEAAFEVRVSVKQEGLSVDFGIKPVTLNPNVPQREGLPKYGLMFDPDIFRDGETTITEFRRFLRAAEEWAGRPFYTLAGAVLPER